MVEYALLTAGTAGQMMYANLASLASSLHHVDWPLVAAGLLLLLTLRFLFTPRV
jgi:hypothetical protein